MLLGFAVAGVGRGSSTVALRGVISRCGGVARARKVPPYGVLSALMKCAQLQGHSRGALPGQAGESGAAEAAGVLKGDEELTGGR